MLQGREVDIQRGLVPGEVAPRDQVARIRRFGRDLDAERRHCVEHHGACHALRLEECGALKQSQHAPVQEREPGEVGGGRATHGLADKRRVTTEGGERGAMAVERRPVARVEDDRRLVADPRGVGRDRAVEVGDVGGEFGGEGSGILGPAARELDQSRTGQRLENTVGEEDLARRVVVGDARDDQGCPGTGDCRGGRGGAPRPPGRFMPGRDQGAVERATHVAEPQHRHPDQVGHRLHSFPNVVGRRAWHRSLELALRSIAVRGPCRKPSTEAAG